MFEILLQWKKIKEDILVFTVLIVCVRIDGIKK